jgi:hypothetical protein
VLHCDPLNTGFNIPQDKSKLALKKNAARLRWVDAVHWCLPFSRENHKKSAIRMGCPVKFATCAPADRHGQFQAHRGGGYFWFGNPGGPPILHAVGREVDLAVAGVGHLRRVLGDAMGRKRRDRFHNHHGLGRRGNVVERGGVLQWLPPVLRRSD